MARKRRPPRPGALTELAPLRILRQIFILQLLYYVSAVILIVFTALVAGKEVKVDLLLNWRTIRGDSTMGWMMAMIWVLNALVSVIFILLFVVRSKLVADFALTVHFINLLVTSFYTHHIPTTLFWWATQASSATTMIILGMWACQWRELKPISFNFSGLPISSSSSTTATTRDVEAAHLLSNSQATRPSESHELTERIP